MQSKDKIKVKLSGTDGNVFAVIGNVALALIVAGEAENAKAFTHLAFGASSYDEVLRLAMTYCEVS